MATSVNNNKDTIFLAIQSVFLLIESLLPVCFSHDIHLIPLPIVTTILLLATWYFHVPSFKFISQSFFARKVVSNIIITLTCLVVALYQSFHNKFQPEMLVLMIFQPLFLEHANVSSSNYQQLSAFFKLLIWAISIGNFAYHGISEFGKSFISVLITSIIFSLVSVIVHNNDTSISISAVKPLSLDIECGAKKDKLKLANNSRHQAIIEWRYIVSNLSHDMKTPLSALVSGIDCLHDTMAKIKDQVASMPTVEKEIIMIEDIVRSMGSTCFFMSMMINRAIDYTKISHEIPLVPFLDHMDVHEVISSCIHCIDSLQSRVMIHLGALPANIHNRIVTDKQWFQENLTCLLSNAIKYTPDGTVDVRFSWMEHPETSASLLKVEVEDMGIGVPAEVMQTIFSHDPIDRELSAGGGAGLGLYTLAKRVETLNGVYGLHARHDAANGSCFWFAIPYLPASANVSACSSMHCRNPMGNVSEKQCSTTGRLMYSVEDTSRHAMTVLYSKSEDRDSAKVASGQRSPTNKSKDIDKDAGPIQAASPRKLFLLHPPSPVSPKSGSKDASSLSASPKALSMHQKIILREVQQQQQQDPSSMISRITSSSVISNGNQAASDQNYSLSLRMLSPTSSVYSSAADTVSSVSSPPSLRILVVDDALPIVKIMRKMLEKAGHIVEEAVNGQDAVDVFRAHFTSEHKTPFDVILMDIQMPILDGIDATRVIRGLEDAYFATIRASSATRSSAITIVDSNCVSNERKKNNSTGVASFSSVHSTATLSMHRIMPQNAKDERDIVASSDAMIATNRLLTATKGRRQASLRWSAQARANKRISASGSGEATVVSGAEEEDTCDNLRIRAVAEACAKDIMSAHQLQLQHSTFSGATDTNNHTTDSIDQLLPDRFTEKEPTKKQAIIIGCSANSDPGTMQAAMNAGMNAFLPKPVTIKAFQQLLAQCLTAAAAPTPEDDLLPRTSL